eukprot:CAMPEP_0117442150 /NCGR_PEP_ID=MMETSP0759-20121206/4002_1 /TAXON_ID=63605 /ORGANISM="Percolomonas cosmopolitus, Strain WS" /LENGTH=1036 /DNA_ID=CAMNT_0005234027 /DNA_START=384 /DNA_END=3494 /DNA_ORIENTATION=-
MEKKDFAGKVEGKRADGVKGGEREGEKEELVAGDVPNVLFAPRKARKKEPGFIEEPPSPVKQRRRSNANDKRRLSSSTAKSIDELQKHPVAGLTKRVEKVRTSMTRDGVSPQADSSTTPTGSETNSEFAIDSAVSLHSSSEKGSADSTTIFYHMIYAQNEYLHRNEVQEISFEILCESPSIRIDIFNKQILSWIGMHFGIKIKKSYIPINERHPHATLSLTVEEQKQLNVQHPDRPRETAMMYQSETDLYANMKESVHLPMHHHMVFPLNILVELDSKVLFLKTINYEIQVFEELHLCKRFSSLNLREFSYTFDDIGLYKFRIHSKSILNFTVFLKEDDGHREMEFSLNRDMDNFYNGEASTEYAFLLPFYFPVTDVDKSNLVIRFHNPHQLSYDLQIVKMPRSKAHMRKCIVIQIVYEQLQQAISKSDADLIHFWIRTITEQEHWKFRSRYLTVDFQSLVIVASQMINELESKLEDVTQLYQNRHQYSVDYLSEQLAYMRGFYLSSHELASHVERFSHYIELRESYDTLTKTMKTVLKNEKKYLRPIYYKQLRKYYVQVMELCGHFLKASREECVNSSTLSGNTTATNLNTTQTTVSAEQNTSKNTSLATQSEAEVSSHSVDATSPKVDTPQSKASATQSPESASESEKTAQEASSPSPSITSPNSSQPQDTSATANSSSLSSPQMSTDSLNELFTVDMKELIVDFRMFLTKLSKQQKLLYTLQHIMQSKNMPQLAQFLREFEDILPPAESIDARNTLYNWIKSNRANKRTARMIARRKEYEHSLDTTSQMHKDDIKLMQPIHFANKRKGGYAADESHLENNSIEFISVSRETLRSENSRPNRATNADPAQEVMRLHKSSKNLADLSGEHYINNRLTVFNEDPFVDELTTVVDILAKMLLNNRLEFNGFIFDKIPQPRSVMQILKGSSSQGKYLVQQVRKYQHAHMEYHHITDEAQREECDIDLLVVFGLHYSLLLPLLTSLMTKRRAYLLKFYKPKSLLLQRRTLRDLLCILKMMSNINFVFDFLGFDKTEMTQ